MAKIFFKQLNATKFSFYVKYLDMFEDPYVFETCYTNNFTSAVLNSEENPQNSSSYKDRLFYLKYPIERNGQSTLLLYIKVQP